MLAIHSFHDPDLYKSNCVLGSHLCNGFNPILWLYDSLLHRVIHWNHDDLKTVFQIGTCNQIIMSNLLDSCICQETYLWNQTMQIKHKDQTQVSLIH